jgi:hypothetical protein
MEWGNGMGESLSAYRDGDVRVRRADNAASAPTRYPAVTARAAGQDDHDA